MKPEDEKQVTFQAVVTVKGSVLNPKHITMAGLTLLNQYDSRAGNYVGEYEEKGFRKHWDSWLQDNGLKQVHYEVDDMDVLLGIEYIAQSMSCPMSNFGNGEEVLVLGPFSESELNVMLNITGCTNLG